MLDKEKHIPGYSDKYIINRHGDIYSFYHNCYLKKRLRKDGYFDVKLTKDKKESKQLLHRLLAITFIDNPENKPEVNHINGVKTDNSLENLEWNTMSENAMHASKTGLRENQKLAARESGFKNRIWPMEMAQEIRRIYRASGTKQIELSRMFNMSRPLVCRIVNNKTYKEECT